MNTTTTTTYRARVSNEGTVTDTWFVYIDASTGGSTMAARFRSPGAAAQVADAINDAYHAEGRLYVWTDDDY